MFGSKTLSEHLLRGCVGLSALVATPFLAVREPWLIWVLLPIAFLALRGCPSCWLVGIFETVARRKGSACRDGSCPDRSLSKR